MTDRTPESLSLLGGVSIGTGVMIGAGVFVLMGQIAEAAGSRFPIAFAAAALVAAVTAYSYSLLSRAYPSSGGIGKFLNEAYGIGTVAAGFTVAMYLSMVLNESLVARTFGTYLLQLFGVDSTGLLVPVLGVVLLIAAFFVNSGSNQLIERGQNAMTVLKVLGLVVFAGACLVVADFPESTTGGTSDSVGFVAAIALAMLAYKGFTTITTTGDEMTDAPRNIGRAIAISLVLVTLVYGLVAIAVRGNLGLHEIIDARDYALAEAARPVFGSAGFGLTAGLAALAAVSSVIASVFATSRILAMLSSMGEVPEVTFGSGLTIGNPPLFVTVAMAMVLTIAFDLTRVAALGVFAYLSLDAAIHWGHLRHLRSDTGARPLVLITAVVLDIALLAGFVTHKLRTDPTIVAIGVAAFIAVGGLIHLHLRRHPSTPGAAETESS